jgi:hypothetical protein
MSTNRRVGRLSGGKKATPNPIQEPAVEEQVHDDVEQPKASGIAAAQAQTVAEEAPAAQPKGRAAPRPVHTSDEQDEPATLMPKTQSLAARQLAEMDEEDEGEDPGLLTRRSRRSDSGDQFHVPEELKKDGWDYEWKTTRINAADVDGSELAFIHEQGWRPVKAKDMPRMCAPGYRGKTIERLGMILCMRPMHLTLAARAEDYEIAETQKQDKLQAASAVPTARPGMINPFVDKMEFVGEVGTHRKKGAAA